MVIGIKDTQEFIVTTDYLSVLKHFIDNNEESLIDEKMGVFIPKESIILASRFDYRVFDRFTDDLEDELLVEQQL